MKNVTIHQRGNDEWFWVYTDGDTGARLESNLTYDTFYAAGRAAATAYPGLPVSAADDVAVPRGLAKRSSAEADKETRFSEKIGSVLAPIVVLLAWRRTRK